MIQSVLFVCIGNICRSPMAEAMLRSRVDGLAVSSAGLAALQGEPADPEAVALLASRGIDLSGHRARQLTPDLLASHELVLVMDRAQERAILDLSPQARGRVQRLGRFGDFEVADPYRRGRAAFEAALELIERGLQDYERALWQARRRKVAS